LTAFADSSAVVKLYADEDGSTVVRRRRVLVVSALARVEVPAALWRKHRMGELSAADAGVLTAAFEFDWYAPEGALLPVAAHAAVLEQAAGLVPRHGLRAYDAVQLASAIAARMADPQVDEFLCFDDVLSAAAGREGWVTRR
jgi:predicted nucleic acid-binding protein